MSGNLLARVLTMHLCAFLSASVCGSFPPCMCIRPLKLVGITIGTAKLWHMPAVWLQSNALLDFPVSVQASFLPCQQFPVFHFALRLGISGQLGEHMPHRMKGVLSWWEKNSSSQTLDHTKMLNFALLYAHAHNYKYKRLCAMEILFVIVHVHDIRGVFLLRIPVDVTLSSTVAT